MEIRLWEQEIPYAIPEAEVPNALHPYLIPTKRPVPCVVVFAGGAYRCRAEHEGEPIAKFFNSCGYQAVVADYRVAPNRFPAGLADAQRAIKLVRYHAAEWGIDPERVMVCGFSAGGNLAASTVLYPDMTLTGHTPDAVDLADPMPNGAILSYPVISIGAEYGHVGSGKNLLGEERYEQEWEQFDLARRVTEQTPPVFLWHTSDDASVNVRNSLSFCEALRNHGVRFELHVYPHGAHGLGLATTHADVRTWAELAANWIARNF